MFEKIKTTFGSFAKKDIINLLLLAIVVLAIPVSVKLVQIQQQIESRASVTTITFPKLKQDAESNYITNNPTIDIVLNAGAASTAVSTKGSYVGFANATDGPVTPVLSSLNNTSTNVSQAGNVINTLQSLLPKGGLVSTVYARHTCPNWQYYCEGGNVWQDECYYDEETDTWSSDHSLAQTCTDGCSNGTCTAPPVCPAGCSGTLPRYCQGNQTYECERGCYHNPSECSEDFCYLVSGDPLGCGVTPTPTPTPRPTATPTPTPRPTATPTPGPTPTPDPRATPTPTPGPTPTPTPVPGAKVKFYKIAESASALENATRESYSSSPMALTYKLQDPVPKAFEVRTLFIQFIYDDNSVSSVYTRKIKYVPDINITSANCHWSADGSGTDVTIKGNFFGPKGKGKVSLKGTNAVIQSWDEATNTVVAKIDQKLEGISLPVVITSDDGRTVESTCGIGVTTIDFTVLNQCKIAGSQEITDADVQIFENIPNLKNPEPHIRQKVSFDKKGKPISFSPKLEKGKKYSILVKAPGSLARKIDFTAQGGTTSLDSIALPVGDIAPASSPDGKVNSVDISEIIRQWSLVKIVTRTGDFNGDGKINSLDYSCLIKNFNASDDTYTPLTVTASPSPTPAIGIGTTQPSGVGSTI